MGSESIAHEAESQYGERNNCFSKIQLDGQKYWEKTTLASKTQLSSHCIGFQSWHFFATSGL